MGSLIGGRFDDVRQPQRKLATRRELRRGLERLQSIPPSPTLVGHLREFLRTVVPGNARQLARSSHEYLWDMLNWFGRNPTGPNATSNANGRQRQW